ncbi:MAG TPA: cytochrome c3 family protein [Dongiaceae bacterium]|nr:cytochrome c3 family protein [Dongiaceae bacterium]
MNKRIAIVLALLASNSFASDVLKFKLGVEFDHKGHQTARVGACTVCHEGQTGKIKEFGKDWAHKNCISCHTLHKKGIPCGGCHKTMDVDMLAH